MGAIDIVCNLYTPEEVAKGHNVNDDHWQEKTNVPGEHQRGVPMDRYVAMMDEADVDVSLLIAAKCGDLRVRHSFAVPIERVAEQCERYPGRFYGLAGIDASRIMESLRDLERAVTEFGFVGAHLYPHWFGWPPDDARYYPFYAKCAELGVPIMMQVGHCLDYQRDRILQTVGHPITLDRVAIDFPELTIIGIHLGWPWTEEMIAVSYKHANVYICGDAYAPKYWPKEYVHFANTFGQDKCLFGTDWPLLDPVRCMREVDGLDLRPAPKQKLLRENAIRVFNLDESKLGSAAPAKSASPA